ncbi:hypothetical protein B296_00004231 [Ensete ventricosum]|uniref:Uncharacterized protein n=1 Tax=Ensete ventricosum TaxID=4639 RepID=A0A427AV03_ENSVE|nr:hypothetical protein B296_00004231 [Ensete ventricosum]
METPLVCKFPNSTSLPPFPGIWNNSPGESSTNSTTATTTGPQSAILSLERLCRRREIKVGEKRKGKAKEKARGEDSDSTSPRGGWAVLEIEVLRLGFSPLDDAAESFALANN